MVSVAIVGSGPSGFYAAESLLHTHGEVEVSMIERLPVPFGLLRHGVAPDHQKLKQTARVYENIAKAERFHLFCNVSLGDDIQLPDLMKLYDAVIIACGANSDTELGIPGEHLLGVHGSTDFVGWYNGHPDYEMKSFDLSCSAAAVIGNGNVALDIARILMKSPEELRKTDIADHALKALTASCVTQVYIIGRRGPAQSKFSFQELREIGRITGCEAHVDHEDLRLNDASKVELQKSPGSSASKNVEIFTEFAEAAAANTERRISFKFLHSPISVVGTAQVTGLQVSTNRLVGEPFNQRAEEAGEVVTLPVGLVFRAVGYRGSPMPGVPFDRRKGVIPTEDGRVLGSVGRAVERLYAAGWIKRGPVGTIGTNRADSIDVVRSLIADVATFPSENRAGSPGLRQRLSAGKHRFVEYDAWHRIDTAEIENGISLGKPRRKFTSVAELLRAAEVSPQGA
jgi:ferredoxin--NADP+ reductase